MVFELNSPEETRQLGLTLGRAASAGQVYALTGDLGVGKTVFTQGFAAGLGVKEDVNSPTFTILQIYESGRLELCHFDVYRIGDIEEMYEVGWEDYVYGDGVCLIEWADLIQELIDEIPEEKRVMLQIEKDPEKGFDYRKVTVCGLPAGLIEKMEDGTDI